MAAYLILGRYQKRHRPATDRVLACHVPVGADLAIGTQCHRPSFVSGVEEGGEGRGCIATAIISQLFTPSPCLV